VGWWWWWWEAAFFYTHKGVVTKTGWCTRTTFAAGGGHPGVRPSTHGEGFRLTKLGAVSRVLRRTVDVLGARHLTPQALLVAAVAVDLDALPAHAEILLRVAPRRPCVFDVGGYRQAKRVERTRQSIMRPSVQLLHQNLLTKWALFVLIPLASPHLNPTGVECGEAHGTGLTAICT
jgi:hypothetical protein